MALYIEVPKDLNEIKPKFALGLTKRQLITFGIAAAAGGLTFWAIRQKIGTTYAAYCSFAVAVPIVFFGLKNFEEKIKIMFKYKKSCHIKTYQSENIYNTIENALEYRRLNRMVKEYERRSE